MSRRPSIRGKDRQLRRPLHGRDRRIDRTEARIQRLTAELDTARAQLTDLRMREAMARARADALQAEVERLRALLEAGPLKRLMRALARRLGRGGGTMLGLAVDP